MIEGRVIGNISSVSVILRSSGSIFGNVSCKSFFADAGSTIVGTVNIHKESPLSLDSNLNVIYPGEDARLRDSASSLGIEMAMKNDGNGVESEEELVGSTNVKSRNSSAENLHANLSASSSQGRMSANSIASAGDRTAEDDEGSPAVTYTDQVDPAVNVDGDAVNISGTIKEQESEPDSEPVRMLDHVNSNESETTVNVGEQRGISPSSSLTPGPESALGNDAEQGVEPVGESILTDSNSAGGGDVVSPTEESVASRSGSQQNSRHNSQPSSKPNSKPNSQQGSKEDLGEDVSKPISQQSLKGGLAPSEEVEEKKPSEISGGDEVDAAVEEDNISAPTEEVGPTSFGVATAGGFNKKEEAE